MMDTTAHRILRGELPCRVYVFRECDPFLARYGAPQGHVRVTCQGRPYPAEFASNAVVPIGGQGPGVAHRRPDVHPPAATTTHCARAAVVQPPAASPLGWSRWQPRDRNTQRCREFYTSHELTIPYLASELGSSIGNRKTLVKFERIYAGPPD